MVIKVRDIYLSRFMLASGQIKGQEEIPLSIRIEEQVLTHFTGD